MPQTAIRPTQKCAGCIVFHGAVLNIIRSINNTFINETVERPTMTGLTAFFLLSTTVLAVLSFGVIAGLAAIFVKFTTVIFGLLTVLSLAFCRAEPSELDTAPVNQRA
jgi:hypothetical protein